LEKLSEDKQYLMTVCEIAMVMLNIRVELLKREQMESEEFKDQIFQEVQTILGKVSSPEVKKVIASRLAGASATVFRAMEHVAAQQAPKNPSKQ
jgi:predicted HAD superfamily phosphohydrolase